MLHLAGADAKGQRSQRSMGRSMRVSAYNRHSWQRQSLLWPDDMYNPLASIGHIIKCEAKFLSIPLHSGQTLKAFFIHHIQYTPSRSRWYVMVKHRDGGIRPVYGAVSKSQTSESLWRSHLVYEMSIDIQNGGFSRGITYDVGVPDFLKHCLWFSLLLFHLVSFHGNMKLFIEILCFHYLTLPKISNRQAMGLML